MASEKVLRDKTFKIASNTKQDGYQRVLAIMVYKRFDKETGNPSFHTGTEIPEDQQLADYTITQVHH